MTEPLTLLIVHAHPDDECISTGGVLPRYNAEGVRTVLVTATRGEQGEIVLPEIDLPPVRAHFGAFRTAELEQAAIILGVSDLEFLGYQDSGMVDTETNTNPACFHMADPDEATGRLVRLIRRYRPQVVMSYNEVGGYGHPDHIACHRTTVAAFAAASDPTRYPDAGEPWTPLKLYFTNSPRNAQLANMQRMQQLGIPSGIDDPNFDITRYTVPDEQITTRINIEDYIPRKIAALHCHRSQIKAGEWFVRVPEELRREFFGYEYFTLATSNVLLPERTDGAYEEDLFAGIR